MPLRLLLRRLAWTAAIVPAGSACLCAQIKVTGLDAAADVAPFYREATWGNVAGSYLKHRVELASAGIHDEALDATREALRYRGCADAEGWIEGVAQHIGDRRRAA